MPFKGKKDNAWTDASVVYGKSGDAWLYGQYALGKKDGVWSRAWTDCRKYDTSGRDWNDPVSVVTYTGTCNNRTATTTITRTKTGCPDDVRATTVASPDCNSGCFTTSTSYYFTGTCQSRTQTERTTYTPVSGSGCTGYFTDATPTASPTCGGNPPGTCWTDVTCNYAGGSVTWDGVLFDVTDIGGGACYSQSRDNIFGCTGGEFELTRLYLCGSTQVYEGQCYSF